MNQCQPNQSAGAASGAPRADWEDLLLAWLHDPFDKALSVQGHERRAADYASAALGRTVSRNSLHRLAAQPDLQSAIAERVPSPNAGTDGAHAVGPADGLKLTHPTSGACTDLALASLLPQPDRAVALIKGVVDDLPGPRERFLALWRLLPDKVAAEFGEDVARLPADTRIPDHSLFQHADITAGLYAAGAPEDTAYLSFALGPVQSFIRAAQSVRDLWSGSALLSWLALQAMKPILDRLGPTAFVYPALRGAPLVDLWLKNDVGLGDRVPEPTSGARMAPSLPHRFVAVVPWGTSGESAAALREASLRAVRTGWRRLACSVHAAVHPRLSPLCADWDRRWLEQIDPAFDFRIAVVPASKLSEGRLAQLFGASSFGEAWPDAYRIRELASAIPNGERPNYSQDSAGRWQAQMEYSARLMAATRTVRHVPAVPKPQDGSVPGKCTLFGSWEQMGPGELSASRAFWEQASQRDFVNGVRIRHRERLCAVALTKRFAGPALLASELSLTPAHLRFPDTATVAAADWLATVGIDYEAERKKCGKWSGLWLHWRKRHQVRTEQEVPEDLWNRICRARKQHGPAPAYYAVVALDGDEIGLWLAGQKTPKLVHLLHPKLRNYFQSLGDDRANAGLAARRPVGPALHAAISAALATFATEVAPKILAEHRGTIIYSGGDDVLALCPVATALRCAHSLRQAFAGQDDPASDGWRLCGSRRRITMGAHASMSGGLVIIHYHDDLRLALEHARAAEQRAKSGGRNALDLVVARRSGETASATCPWGVVPWLEQLRAAFAMGASDRWTYRLRRETPTLASSVLPPAAMEAEIRRLVGRSNADAGHTCDAAGIVSAFGRYRAARRCAPVAEVASDFVTLCQSASFMARG